MSLPAQASRRDFIKMVSLASSSLALPLSAFSFSDSPPPLPMSTTDFWPNGARLAVSFSLMFEGTGQPISGASGPITEAIQPGFPDLPTNSFFEYGMNEGVPRLLNLFDKHNIKVSSFMIGEAVDQHPTLAAEVARRGHECAAHGRRWSEQYTLSREEEKQWIQDSVASIKRATGQQAVGYNCYWMRDSVRTLEILQELGFRYHIDDLSRDEPFVQQINGKPFATVPYTVHMNDIASFGFDSYSPQSHLQALIDEFDQLYEEAATRRRMLVMSCHDRIAGRPNRVRVIDRFIEHIKKHEGVWFARKDEIADWALKTPAITPQVTRLPAPVSGLPGPSH